MVGGRHVHAQDLARLLRRLQLLKQRVELLRGVEEREEWCFSNLLLRILLAMAEKEVDDALAVYAEILEGVGRGGLVQGFGCAGSDEKDSASEKERGVGEGGVAERRLREEEAKIVVHVLRFLMIDVNAPG